MPLPNDPGYGGAIPFHTGKWLGPHTTPPAGVDGDMYVDTSGTPQIKIHKAGAWVNVDYTTDTYGLLSDLANVNINRQPAQGDALIFNQRDETWGPGNVPAHITEWDNSSRYAAGTTVMYKGGFFRALKDNSGISPNYADGSAMVFLRANPNGSGDFTGPLPMEYVHVVADHTLPPTDVPTKNLPLLALTYQDDNNWTVWKWDLVVPAGWKPGDPVPVYQWHDQSSAYKTAPNGVKLWRGYSVAPQYYADYSLWIYGSHTSTHAPVVPQDTWGLVMIRHDLTAAHDVEAYDPKKGDILEFDPTWSTWKATDTLEQLKKRVAALEAAPPPPPPGPVVADNFTLADAKLKLGIASGDSSKDTLITMSLNASLAIAERYCDRYFRFKEETVEFFNIPGPNLQLKRYPISSIVRITDEAGTTSLRNDYRVHNLFGRLESKCCNRRHWHCDSVVKVTYQGGYQTLPSDLVLALWGIFDAVWQKMNPTSGSTTLAPGAISSISIPDVGTVSFAQGGGASAASVAASAVGGQYGPFFYLLDSYKDLSC